LNSGISGQGSVAGFCEHRNEHSCRMIVWESLEHLIDIKFSRNKATVLHAIRRSISLFTKTLPANK
jgi:hypothetical protein